MPGQLARKVGQWRDEVCIGHMDIKGVKMHRCQTCRMPVKTENHECFIATGEKNRYVGGVPYVESKAVGRSGTKILQKVTHTPNLQHMDQVARRTELDWIKRTKTPDPLPEGILPKHPVVQKPSVYTAQAVVHDPRTPEEIAQRQTLKRKSPGLDEANLDVLMDH